MKITRLKPEYRILAFILIVGVILRVLNLSDYEMQLTEQHTLTQMMSENSDELFLVNPQTERYAPVYDTTVKFYTVMAGLSLLNMRIPSILAGLVAIGLMFVIGRRLYSEDTGLVASGIFAFIWTATEASRTAGPDIFLVLMILISGYLFGQILTETTRRTGPELQTWLGFTLVLTILAYTHQFGVFLALTLAVLSAGYAAGQKRALVPALLSLTLLVVMCAPLTLMLNELTSIGNSPGELLSGMFWSISSISSLIKAWIFVITGLVAVFTGSRMLINKGKVEGYWHYTTDLLLGGWIVIVVLAGTIASLFNIPVEASEVLIVILPAVILIWSAGANFLFYNTPTYLRTGIAIAFLLMLHSAWQLFTL